MIGILTTFLVSMVPVIELRGAIPIGVAAGVPLWQAILISIIGNMIPVPLIILFVKKDKLPSGTIFICLCLFPILPHHIFSQGF